MPWPLPAPSRAPRGAKVPQDFCRGTRGVSPRAVRKAIPRLGASAAGRRGEMPGRGVLRTSSRCGGRMPVTGTAMSVSPSSLSVVAKTGTSGSAPALSPRALASGTGVSAVSGASLPSGWNSGEATKGNRCPDVEGEAMLVDVVVAVTPVVAVAVVAGEAAAAAVAGEGVGAATAGEEAMAAASVAHRRPVPVGMASQSSSPETRAAGVACRPSRWAWRSSCCRAARRCAVLRRPTPPPSSSSGKATPPMTCACGRTGAAEAATA